MIVLGDMKDCDECKEPTKKRVGTMFDAAGPGSVSPVWDCENTNCKRAQDAHMRYLIACDFGKGGGGND